MISMLYVNNLPTEAREKMLYAALQLFTTRGYKNTSVLDIVEYAHVSKTTFYQQFGNKETLIVSLCQSLIEEMADEIKLAALQEPRVGYKAYAGILRYLEICFSNKAVANFILLESVGVSYEVEMVRREALKSFADLIFAFAYREFPENVNEQEVRIVSQAMVGAINEVVIQKFREPKQQQTDVKYLARLLNRMVMSSFNSLSNN